LQTYFEFEPVWFPRLLTAFERDALNTASVVAAVSTPLAGHLAPLCREPRRIVVLPNGANPQRFRFDAAARDRVRARLGLEGAVVVGWSGILRAWHGLDLLLDAAARIPGSRLMIVGDGADRPRLTAHAARLGLADRLVITGRVPHDEVPHYIAAMDIAVVAHDRTGVASPMKLLEYMAIGRAVVAPRLPNIQDIISEEVDGLLFDPGSVDALAAALQRLATHESIRQALGSQARVKIERERNWGNNAARVLEALDAIEPRPARIRANSEARI
jgi:glycosyltransferase involved in cell wall biosynthesis